jgi:hypothetical protein
MILCKTHVATRVETKTLFSFSRKVNISKNLLTFHKILFCENFGFHENEKKGFCFLFSLKFFQQIFVSGMVFAKILGNIHQCSDLDTHSSASWIRIRIPNGKFSQKLSRNQNFCKTFRDNKNFCKFL